MKPALTEKLGKLIKWGLCLTLITPLIVFQKTIYPYFFSKAIFFQLAVEVLAILSLCYILAEGSKEKNKLKTPLSWALFIFIIFSLISAIFGINFNQSFWSNFERMDGLFFFLHLFVYFLLLRLFFKEKEWKHYWNFFLGTSFVTGVVSLISPGDVVGRISGVFGNPLYLAIFFVFSTFIAVWLFTCEREKIWRKFLYGILATFFFVLVLLAGSRGPFAGMVLGLFGAGVLNLFNPKRSKKTKTVLTILLICSVILGVLGYVFRDIDVLEGTPVQRVFKLWMEKERLLTWQIAVSAWQEKPVLGWGEENFETAFSIHFKPELFNCQELWFDKPHNKYLEILVGKGILGLLSYLSIVGVLLFYLIKLSRKRGNTFALFSGLLFAYFFQNFVLFDTISSYIVLFGVFAFLDSEFRLVNRKKANSDYIRVVNLTNAEKMLSVLLLILLVTSIYQYNGKALRASLLFKSAIGLHEQPHIPGREIVKIYKEIIKAYPQNAHKFRLLMVEQIANLAIQGDARFQDKEVLEEVGLEMKKNLESFPLSVKSYLGLAKIYQLLGVLGNDAKYLGFAEKVLKDGLNKFPQRVDFYLELAKTEMHMGNEDQAQAYCEKAKPLEC